MTPIRNKPCHLCNPWLKKVGLFVVVGFAQAEVGQLAERSHAAASFRRVDFRIDDWLVLADRSRRKSDLLRLRIDTQDLEIHLLSELDNVFRLRNALF